MGFAIVDKYRLCWPLEEWEFQRGAERKVVQVTPLVIAQNAEGLVAAVLAGGRSNALGMLRSLSHLIGPTA